MIVICEECAKKYDIDVSKIKGEKAYFPCRKCSHQIIVEKRSSGSAAPPASETQIMEPQAPEPAAAPSAPEMKAPSSGLSKNEEKIADILSSSDAAGLHVERKKMGRGIPLAVYFILPLLFGFLAVNGAFGYLFLKNVPPLLHDQMVLRGSALSAYFHKTVESPLQSGDFLQIARESETLAKMKDIAYVAVINEQGAVVSGTLGDESRFDPAFAAQVKQSGFPGQALQGNKVGAAKREGSATLIVGGRKVLDNGVALQEINGELHVGVFTDGAEKSMRKLLLSPLVLGIVVAPWVIGLIAFMLLARYIATPLQDLTAIVQRISLGELDLAVEAHGPSELREFAKAFDRMRYSIREAINRLKNG